MSCCRRTKKRGGPYALPLRAQLFLFRTNLAFSQEIHTVSEPNQRKPFTFILNFMLMRLLHNSSPAATRPKVLIGNKLG